VGTGLRPVRAGHSPAPTRQIGSDLQRPFAIVIVGGLIVELVVSLVMMSALHVFWVVWGRGFAPFERGRAPLPHGSRHCMEPSLFLAFWGRFR
jgi:hypothetical protein